MNEPLTLDALRQHLAAVHDAVREAVDIVASDGIVDLGGMERRVETICAALDTLPKPDRTSALPLIEALMADLDVLAEKLRTQKDAAASGLQSAELRNRAVHAYGKTPR